MADGRIRLAVGVVGPRTLDIQVAAGDADRLMQALADGDRTITIDSDDGPLTLVLSQVVYVQRAARESQVGFGA